MSSDINQVMAMLSLYVRWLLFYTHKYTPIVDEFRQNVRDHFYLSFNKSDSITPTQLVGNKNCHALGKKNVISRLNDPCGKDIYSQRYFFHFE